MQFNEETRRRAVYVTAVAIAAGIVTYAWRQSPVPQGPAVTAAAGSVPGETLADAGASAGDDDKAVTEAKEANKSKYQEYVVQEGDTVEAVAAAFGLGTESILYTNDLDEDDLLQIGQTLLIPSVDGLVYQIQEGDTLWDIAVDHGVTEDVVVQANPDLDPGAIQAGQVVLVPGGKPQARRQMASRGGGSTRSTLARSSGSLSRWPTSGLLTDSFGWRVHPVYGSETFHDGMDISVPEGTPVMAAEGGTVTMASRNGGYGLMIKIDHGNGIYTEYAHLSDFNVEVGEYVNAGDVIGWSGNTGVSTGPHLHFMVLQDGSPVDPAAWLP